MATSHPSGPSGAVSRFRPQPVAAGINDPGPVPNPLTPLIGRDDAITTLCTLLNEPGVRLATLTGPGGVGKTRLALAVASSPATGFPDGVAFVPLATVTDATGIFPAIARSLGIANRGSDALVNRLAGALADRKLLLVLDNTEQIPMAGPSIAALLTACPGLHALVTSRSALNVAGEHVYPLPPLAMPDRAFAIGPDNLAIFLFLPAQEAQRRAAPGLARSPALAPTSTVSPCDHWRGYDVRRWTVRPTSMRWAPTASPPRPA
jgi:hypothetical protein